MMERYATYVIIRNSLDLRYLNLKKEKKCFIRKNFQY